VSLHACAIQGRIIRGAVVGVSVQPPGRGATAHGQGDDTGGDEELSVTTSLEGIVTVTEQAHNDSPSGINPTDQGCSQLRYHDSGNKRKSELNWGFHKATTPSYISQANAEFAIASGANWMTSGYNDCGLPASGFGASHIYNGNSERPVSVSPTGDCTGEDGHNRVAFGRIDGSVLAWTCTYFDSVPFVVNTIDEVDILFDNTNRSWFTSKPASCSGAYDLASTATHEWGHAFGLRHPTDIDSTQTSLTMATAISCDTRRRTLGRGDYLGMTEKY
jgi:hypothetical protein